MLLRRPAQIGFGVFMGAAHKRFVRQGREALECSIHVLSGAFKQSTAATGKEGVAAKHQRSKPWVLVVVVPKDERDMGGGVGRHIDHLKTSSQKVDRVAISDACGLKRNSEPICSGCDDLRLGPFAQQFWGPADVIGVMVGLQDRGQAHPVRVQPLTHWLRHCWIHDDGVLAPDPDPNHVVL